MHILTANTDKIIINLKGGPINNIDGPIEVLQKFIAEQVIKYFYLKIKLIRKIESNVILMVMVNLIILFIFKYE